MPSFYGMIVVFMAGSLLTACGVLSGQSSHGTAPMNSVPLRSPPHALITGSPLKSSQTPKQKFERKERVKASHHTKKAQDDIGASLGAGNSSELVLLPWLNHIMSPSNNEAIPMRPAPVFIFSVAVVIFASIWVHGLRIARCP